MEPSQVNISLYKGQTWNKQFRFKVNGTVMNLEDYSFKAQIRPVFNSETLCAEMSISVSPEEGIVTLGLTAEQTANLEPKTLVWDLQSVDENQKVDYWLYGNITINGRATV